MFETAFVAFSAGSTQVVVVAEFVTCCAAFYFVEDGGVYGDGRVETAWGGDP